MPLQRTASPIKALKPGLVVLVGNFTGNGTSNPSAISFKGVTAVTRTALGRYTLVLPGTGSLTIASFSLCVESANDFMTAQIRSYTASTRTLIIDVLDDINGSPAQADLVAGEKMYITAFVANSSGQ